MRALRSSTGWWFVAFPLAIVVLFTGLPALGGVGLSFFHWSGGADLRFVGLENYTALTADRQFWLALRNTAIFTAVTVPLTVVAAFVLAVAMNARWFAGKSLVRVLFFLPTVISIVAIGFIWQWVLAPKAGLLDMALQATGAAGEPINWLEGPRGLGTIMFIQVWRNAGFCIVLYLAALGRVPKALHDAASIDGASGWAAMWHVTWPTVRPMTAFLLITGAIWALQVFDLVWIVTGGASGAWTDVLNTFLYREFKAPRPGFAAAIGVLILVLAGLVTAAQLRWFARHEKAAA